MLARFGRSQRRSDGNPAQNRFCWIRGDLTFDSLRQAVIEPERRVWIGEAPPPDGGGGESIVRLQIRNAPWLSTPTVPINTGLTAVIGSRGSGKTALVEMIAHGSGATGWVSKSSFLYRATEHLVGSTAQVSWADGTILPSVFLQSSNTNLDLVSPGVRYLSQHFVERLCSATGLATELRSELERVVFDATDPTQRMRAESFAELAQILLEPIEHARAELRDQLLQTSDAIVQESLAIDALPKNKQDRDAQAKAIESAQHDLKQLIPKGSDERAARLAALESALSEVSLRVEGLRRRRKSVEDLRLEVKQNREVSGPAVLARLRERFKIIELTPAEWNKFALSYGQDVDAILTREAAWVETAIATAVRGDGTPIDKQTVPLKAWPLEVVTAERDAVKMDVGIDAEMLKRYDALQRQIAQMEATRRNLQETIASGEGAPARRDALVQRRRVEYQEVLETLLREEDVLRGLYAPLATQLTSGQGALAKLKLVVGRHVDTARWAEKGERLLDLRKTSRFRGEGSLLEIANERLSSIWASGTAESVAAAIYDFYEEFRSEFLNAMPPSTDRNRRREWEQSLATWLFDTSHIQVHYSVRYDNLAIEKLSPGTRGIVLLLLYLVLDRADRRPIIIDQPEENLDPQSVFSELVPHFLEARSRRQVIIVTHNANLVINTDADQVIVARATPSTSVGMPTISYVSGSLENANIRRCVCDILEGGDRAFMERAKRYRIRLP